MNITVYQSRDSLRVVAGEHQPHAGSSSARVAVYPDASLAYAAESDAGVRAAILRIAPDAAGAKLGELRRVAIRAPQVPALPGMTPLGMRLLAQPHVPDAIDLDRMADDGGFADDRVYS